MSRILTQVKSLVKGDVVITEERESTVRAVVPHPRLEDHVLVMFTGSTPSMEREGGELVRIKERKRPIY